MKSIISHYLATLLSLAILGRESFAAVNAVSNVCPFTGASYGAPMLGQVTVANSGQNAALSTPITSYVSGVPADDLEIQLDLLCPANETGTFFEYWKSEDSDFLTEVNNDDIRAVDAAFKRVSRSKGSRETGRTYNKGLTMRIDLDAGLYTNGSGSLRDGAVEEVALSLRKRLVRAELLRFYGILDAAAGAGTDVTWNAAGNPDGDIRRLLQAGLTSLGVRADRVAMGSDAWTARADAYEAPTRTDMTGRHAEWDQAKLAQYLMISNVVVDQLIYNVKRGGAKSKGLGPALYSYLSPTGLTAMDPSNVKRFFSPTKQGGKWAVYVEEKPKFVDVTVEHYSTFIAPQTLGIGKLVIDI